VLRRRYISQFPHSAQHRGKAHAEIPLQIEHLVERQPSSAEFLLDDRPDLGGGHQERGREHLGEFLARMVERDIIVDEEIGVFDDRPLVAVLEVMAVFVGGGEGLAAGCVGAVDEGEGRFPVLEEDEGAGELGAAGDGQAEDAAAVELGEGEDVADGLIAETEAAAFLFGQALGGDCGVEGSEREEAIGAALEPQIVVAVAFEALEDGLGGGVEAFGPFEGVSPEEDVEGAFFLLEEVAEVFLEVGGDLVQGGLGVRKWGNVLKI